MIKELLLAVILGALLGFGVTGGVVALKHNKASITPPDPVITPTISGTVTTSPQSSNNSTSSVSNTDNHQITIEFPENNAIVTNSKVTIKGSTSPQSSVIISTLSKTYFATADNAGNFSTDIEIDSGVNQVQIDSIDSQDNQTTTQLLITYSTTKI